MKHSNPYARRLALALPLAGMLGLAALPAFAASTPTPTPAVAGSTSPTPGAAAQAATIQQAQDQLAQAQAQAATQQTSLAMAQQNVATIRATITTLQASIAAYDIQITADQEQVDRLHVQLNHDKDELAAYLRASYESGTDTSFYYITHASSFSDLLDRYAQVNQVSERGTHVVERIRTAQASIQLALDDATQKRQAFDAANQQATTEAALLDIEVQQVQALDQQAQANVQIAQANVAAAVNNQALQAVGSVDRTGVIYAPVTGVAFTIDTDLTQPSGETADRLNAFLRGSALQGLGQAYMNAEATYHVSARYLVAHAIEESAFGTSKIARDKHNLFGYGANDANPYDNAVTFASFAASIDFVASKVAANYLSPTGSYYHGPTLRGMNVSYATDPIWANNIARIALSFS